jgi:hypothetical protein
LAASGTTFGSIASICICGSGRMKQKASPFSNRTVPGRVKRQFIENVNGSQSVSTSPSSATMPSFREFGSPRHQIAHSGSVRNR